jgi:hypothetical protein
MPRLAIFGVADTENEVVELAVVPQPKFEIPIEQTFRSKMQKYQHQHQYKCQSVWDRALVKNDLVELDNMARRACNFLQESWFL